MYYEYKVTYWNDANDAEEKDHGLVYGENYGDAAEKVDKDYGNSLIDMYLQEWEDTNTVSLYEIKEGFKLYS